MSYSRNNFKIHNKYSHMHIHHITHTPSHTLTYSLRDEPPILLYCISLVMFAFITTIKAGDP